ncbi:class I SAM-dependent methyltransferase [soil metagenome]
MDFKDHFSTQAADYAKYRPDYPQELYDFMLLNGRGSHVAWDCGTGNGQVAVVLSDFFEYVVATDPSAKQIENAMPAPNVEYSVAPAEASGLPDNSVDLITVGQAVHWFDFERFYAEARRVAKPEALILIWGYGLHSINREVDAVINEFYYHTIGSYWPPERKHLDNEYRDIPFPFQQIDVPPLVMEQQWTLEDVVGYLSTWSSVQAYIKANKTNPLQALWPKLSAAWGDKDLVQTVRWPLYTIAGYVQ